MITCPEQQVFIRKLSQGDAASCATQEATNPDGAAFFGPLCPNSMVVPYKRFRKWVTQLSRVLFVYM